MEHPVNSKQTYYPYFDYLRAIAAFGVFVAHADTSHYLPEQLGGACVDLFFVLSGFLIGGILLRSHPKEMPQFYFNRATRIWIPYAVAIALLATVTAFKQGLADPKISEFFFYMATFVYNWFGPPQLAEFRSRMPLDGTGNHFWSICVEEQFYLVAPFLIIFANRALLVAGLIGASLFSAKFFLSISAGVALALVGPSLIFTGAAVILGATVAFLGFYRIAVSLFSVAIVSALAKNGKPTTVGKIAGGASYSFYLNHWIGLFGINAVAKLGAPYWLSWTSGLVIASAFSIAHYFAIDRNIARYREKWFSLKIGALLCMAGIALVALGFAGAYLYGAMKV